MNHTPGPWKAKIDAQPVPFKRETRYGAIEIWPADQRFAKVAKLLPQDDLSMTQANARLISAAPDLLEAAKLLLDAMGAEGIQLCAQGQRELRAAIQKAEGK